jgi:hypothetical protein
VANMLVVPALEFCYPVAIVILMESNDPLQHYRIVFTIAS